MALSAESIAEYKSSLKDLNVNSKPLINMLTMLAEDHEQHAAEIVKVIEDHINKCKPAKKLPVLYLIDSIMKNLGESTNYKSCFSKNIVQTFTSVFEQVDEKTRASMFKLRQTWTSILANSKLYMIDVRINNLMDPAWPVTATAPEKTSIHVNPKFLNKAGSSGSGSERSSPEMVFEEDDDAQDDVDPESLDQEAIMRQQLIAKQQELIELQQARIKLELAEAEEKLKSLGKHGAKSQTATTSKLSGLPLPPVVDNSDLIDPVWTAPQPAKDPRKKQPPDPRKRDPRLQMQQPAHGSEFMKGPQDMEGTVSSTVPFMGHPGGPMMGHPGGPMMGQGVPPHMPYPVMNQMDSMQFPHGVPPFVPRGFGEFKGMIYQEEAKFSDSNDSDSSRSSFQDNRSGQAAGQQKMNVKDPRLRKQYEEVQRRKSENKDTEQSNKSRDPRRPAASPKSSSGHQHKDPNESRESSKHSPKDPQTSRSSRDNTSSKSPRKSTSDTQTSKGRSTSKDRDSKSYPNLRDTFEAAKRKHDSDKEREKEKDSKFYKKDSGSRYSDRSSRSREKSPPHQSKHQSNKNSHKGSGDNSVSSKSAHDNRNRDRNKDNNSSKASNKKSSNHSDSKRGNKSADSRQDSYKAPKSIKREKCSPEGDEGGRASKKPKLSIKEEPAEIKQEIKQEVDMEVDQKPNVNVSNDLSELFGSEDIDHRPVDAKGLPLKSPSSKGWDKFKASQPDQFAYDIELKKQRQDLDQRRTRQMSEACENQDTDYRIQGQGDSLMSPPIIEREIPKELSLSQHSEIIIQAQKQLREGKITAKQHQDLMQQVQELMHIQQQLQDENSKTGENTQEMAAELSVSESSARNLFHSFESEVKQEPYNDESSLALSQGYTENQGEGRVRSPDRPLERFRIPKKSHDANSPKKDKRGLHELYPERIKEEAWESGPPVLAREFDRPPDNMDHPDYVAPPNLNDSRRPPQNRRQDHRDQRGMNNRRDRGGSAEKFREYPDDYNMQQGRRDQYDRPDGPPDRRQGPPSDWPEHGDRQGYPPFDQHNKMGAPHPQDMGNPLDPRRRDPRLFPGREMDVGQDQVHPDQKFMDMPQDPNWIRSPRDEAERRDDIGRGRLHEEEFHRLGDERGPFRNDEEFQLLLKGPMGRGHGPPDWERPGFDQDGHPNFRRRGRDDPNMPPFDRHGPPYMGPEGHRSPPYGRPGPPDHEHGKQDPRRSDRDDHFSKRNSEKDSKKEVPKEIVSIVETRPGKRVIDANGVMKFIPDPGYESPPPQEKSKPESLVKPEFDKVGPPRPEFGREGPPRPEIDRDGPPRPELEREGPPRPGFEGPPRPEFNRDGPPRPGFEYPPRPEFNRDGPPRPGFDREGPQRPGFEGPPRPEFDREGPPRPGFDREGPPRPGFDREGPPRPGFEGPPRPEFDREGPLRPGFDREGPLRPEFDREGPPRPGFEGPPRPEFDREGPPRPEFDREGPPRLGFDRDGPPRPEFDREGPPRPGFDREGPPRPGFDGPHPPHPEFDRQGPNFDRPGPPRPEMDRPGPLDEKLRSPGYGDRMRPPGPEFDRPGPHMPDFDRPGPPRSGFDRQGPPGPEFDRPGHPDFDRPGPNFDRQGHPRPEFDRSGPPRPDFDRPGPPGNEFNRPDHPRSEFDRDRPGHPRPDFDRSGPARPEFEGPDRGRPDFDRHGPPGPGFDGPRPLIPEFDRQGPEFDRQGRPGPEFDRPDHPRHGRPDFEGPGTGRPEFDRPGPHGPEFKREGPHGPEFERQGPGRPEFDGPGRPEFNRPGPHGPEFDRPGPHGPEFNRPGPHGPEFDRAGPHCPEFDRAGPPNFDRHGPPRSDTDKGPFRPEFDRHRDMDGHRGPPRHEFEGEFERDGPPFDRHRKFRDYMEEEDRYRERFDRRNRGRDQDWHENREYDPEFERHGRRDDDFDRNRRRRGHGPDTRDGEFEPRDRDWNRGHDDKHPDRDRSGKQPDRKSPEKVNKNDKPSKQDDIEKTKNENSKTEKKPQPVQEEKKEEKMDTKKSGKAFDPNKGLPPWRPVDSPVKKPSKMDKQSNREDRREDRRSPPLKDRRTPPLKDRRTPPIKDQKVSDKLPSILDGIEPELIANQGQEGPERPAFPTGPSFNPLPSQLPGIPDPPHVKLEREKQIEKEKKDKQKSNRQDKNDKRKEEKRSSKEKDDRRGTRAEKEDRRGRQNKEDKRGPGRPDKDERRGRPDRDDRRDRFNKEDRRGHLQPLHPQDFVESYVDKYGDPRFRSFTDMGPEVSEEVVFGKRNYEIKLGAPPRKIQWGNGYIEVYADPSKRGVVIDNELMYRFGERVKEVNIRGKREKMFYHGQPLDIWIDGNNYEVRVDSPPKTLIINNQPHRIQVDGRDMMILINKAEMGPYGGEPRFILIDDMRMELRFDPPPRHILIDGEMCELKLNTNQPCINIKGVLHGIRFKGPPRDLFINGTCYQVHTDHAVKLKVGNRFHYVALGGPCHELIVDGKWYEVKFDEPPKEISVGNRALMVHIPGGPPEVKILDPIPMDPVHMPMFNPAGPMRMPMPGPPGPLGPMGPGPMGPPQMIPGMPPGMMMGPPVTGPNPMVNPAIPGMRPSMAPQPTTGIPGLGNVIPGIQPSQPNPLPMSGMGPTPGMPSVLSGLFPARPAVPTTSAPGGGLDINSLLSKLVSSGIIKKDGETKQQPAPVIETPAAPAPSKPAKSDNSAIVAEAIRVAAKKKTYGMNKSKTIPDKTSFDISDLKELHDGAIDRLYAGTQCTSCGARFLLDSEEKTAKYQQHLDWHFRQNKLKKDDTKVTQYRKWYYGVGDWIQYEEVTDLDEQAKSVFFEQQNPAQPATPANPQHTITLPEGLSVIKCPPATGNDQDDLCNICHEPFEQYWDEEQEQWHLREAIRVNNKTYHPICYEDYTDVSEGTPSPSILLDKQPDFSSRKSLTYEESSQDGIPHSSFEEERNVPNVSPSIKTEPVMALETKIKSEPETYTTDSGVKIETDSNIGETSALSGGQLGTSIKQEPVLSDSVSSTSGLSQDSQYVVKYEPMEGEEGQSEFLSSNHRKGAIPGLEVSVSETEHVDTSDTKTMETDSDIPHTSDSVVKMETGTEDIAESGSDESKPMETAESSVSSVDQTSDRATPTLDEDAQLEHIEGHSAYNHPSQSLITEQASSSLSYTTESAFHRPSQLHHIDSNTETHSLNVPSHHSSTLSPLKRVIVSQPSDMIEISQEVLEISSNASTPTHDELPSPPSPGS